jgi:catechol 2,3-dioxygenase-like lactoylglutathione lyase family enzyme
VLVVVEADGVPDPTILYRLRDGAYAVDLLIAAVAEFDLFSWLAGHGPKPAAVVRAELGLTERPADVLLTYLGLRTAPDASKAAADDRFDPNRVGLDHLSLVVGSHADHETAVELCKARGVTCGEIVDFGPTFGFFVLMLEDPDGIQIELVANYA